MSIIHTKFQTSNSIIKDFEYWGEAYRRGGSVCNELWFKGCISIIHTKIQTFNSIINDFEYGKRGGG